MEQTESTLQVKRQTGIALALALSMLLAALGTSIANIALPALAEAFSAPFTQVQAVMVGYLVALTVAVLIAGRLGDRWGLKPALIGGLILFAVSSVLCSLASGLWWLVAARALQGIGAAFLMTLAMALMRQTTPQERMGRAMGLLGMTSALGTALGPTLGGLLLAELGWRSIFWVLCPLACIALMLILVALPTEPGKRTVKPPGLWSALDRHLAPGLIVNVLVAGIVMTTLVVGPFYLGTGLGLDARTVGLVMATGPGIAIFCGIPSGRLVDAWGSRRVLSLGLFLLATGAIMLAFVPNAIGAVGYVLSVMVLTPGYQLFQTANNTGVLSDVPKERQGTVSGLLNLSRNIGLIAGASVMGALFSFGAGTEDIAHATVSAIEAGMRLTFLVAAGAVVCGIAIVRMAGR